MEGPLHLNPRRAAFSSTGEVAGSERGRPVAATGLVRKPEEKSRKNEKKLAIFDGVLDFKMSVFHTAMVQCCSW